LNIQIVGAIFIVIRIWWAQVFWRSNKFFQPDGIFFI